MTNTLVNTLEAQASLNQRDKIVDLLDSLNNTEKIPLTVPAMIYHYKKGRSDSTIARIHCITRSAVSDYKQRHFEELSVLMPDNDGLLAINAKHIAYLAQQQLLRLLPQATQKDLMPLNAISGTHIDKYRLLSDKSTTNVNFSAFILKVTDLNKARPFSDQQTIDVQPE